MNNGSGDEPLPAICASRGGQKRRPRAQLRRACDSKWVKRKEKRRAVAADQVGQEPGQHKNDDAALRGENAAAVRESVRRWQSYHERQEPGCGSRANASAWMPGLM